MSLRTLSAQKYTSRNYNNGANPADDPVNSAMFVLKSAASNTFTDVSLNAYTVTNNGSVTSSNSTAKFTSTYSASFSGSNYLSVADASPLRPGSGSFTWEFWWYPTNLSSYRTPLTKGYVSSGDLLIQTGAGDGKLLVYASGSVVVSASTAVTVNTWSHVAVVRNGTAMTIYVNGTAAGTATVSTNLNSTQPISIGGDGGSYGSVGYIQDLRISNTAIYTADFTPPGTLS